ncbi:MAG: hypothetical protein FRX49_12787 [Trebouxia sp. A1-2]|nr:MAG: hypothetical protein FRX49_12787 [Trebouxia sp. A1-2]
MALFMLLLTAVLATTCAMTGATEAPLNVTLQLTTMDFLSVSTLLHAAAEVWGVNQTSITVISATARHAELKSNLAGARQLLESKNSVANIQLDFAAMQKDDPKLLTLKDFVMSANQAPESPSDVLSLLQAFSEFKQGSVSDDYMDNPSGKRVQLSDDYMDSPSARPLYVSDDYMDSPSARYALAAMKPSPKLDAQKAASHSKDLVSLPHTDTHPHLLFLKTGGGATVAQPNHHLTPQQLQMLADGTGTLEGLTDIPDQPLAANPKPVTATIQKQGHPLGVATGILDAQSESTQQLGSLFTPRNGQAITKAMHALSHAESQQASQGLFSSGFDSVSDQQTVPAVTSQVRPSAKSLQGVYLDQPHADKAGFSALKAVSAAHRSDPSAGHGQSLSWLDEPLVDMAKPGDIIQKPSGALDRHSDIIQMPLSHSFLSDESVGEQKPALRSAVLLTMVLSIATKQSEALQRVIGDSILSRHFQQQIAKQGFTVNQLDASFDRQGVFSSRGGAFSVEMAEVQGDGGERVKVSVRTVVQPQATLGADADGQDSKQAVMQGEMVSDGLQSSWLELLICAAGFVAAFSARYFAIFLHKSFRFRFVPLHGPNLFPSPLNAIVHE